MLERWRSEAICLQANEMLERTIVSSASMWPACSCFRSHVVRFSISYLFFFTLAGAVAGGAGVPISTALQRIRGGEVVAAGCARCNGRRRWRGDRRVEE